jgi:hypothetical protein
LKQVVDVTFLLLAFNDAGLSTPTQLWNVGIDSTSKTETASSTASTSGSVV